MVHGFLEKMTEMLCAYLHRRGKIIDGDNIVVIFGDKIKYRWNCFGHSYRC
jgi:hypothetical protein